MDWFERMNRALDYIEAHLDGEIDNQQAAQLALCSVYHFQKMFSMIMDASLAEYIRRRRLTMAAFDIQHSQHKIIDIALKYGYESPEAFARAFQALHGLTPTSARGEGVMLKAYPRLSFQISIRGDVAMDYRIIKKEAFAVYGIDRVFMADQGEHLIDIPQFWIDSMQDGSLEKLSVSAQKEPEDELSLINAVCWSNDGKMDSSFRYMLFTYMADHCNAEGYTMLDVPASTWAIFRTREHSQEETSVVIQELIKRIYTEWLPTASYNHVDEYELELYYGQDAQCYSEVWIRVIPKL
ncbi:AraC family transcriptional regulator [Paenibacillus antarcticus]|uniref:AraC family transcriptional regulator n=1 Tax=Paenibacillus antarcticus TaxID=253703 RepID=A0A162Q127_9BACL|nr:helix-turn-helix domain-containing protein [Paenibacillus antarcticus]OAB41190.1 AraC family transcriptional regulator [Paenibacillus antarcticus]